MKKLLLIALVCTFLLSGCGNYSNNNYVVSEKNYNSKSYITIKYRDTLVDISKFRTVDTSSSSFIKGAYYDLDNQYLILNLDGTYYHWCDVPEYIWNEFKNADSFGKYYNQYIKGDYDCRLGYVPQYD